MSSSSLSPSLSQQSSSDVSSKADQAQSPPPPLPTPTLLPTQTFTEDMNTSTYNDDDNDNDNVQDFENDNELHPTLFQQHYDNTDYNNDHQSQREEEESHEIINNGTYYNDHHDHDNNHHTHNINNHNETIEALEQALKIQINKRMTMEMTYYTQQQQYEQNNNQKKWKYEQWNRMNNITNDFYKQMKYLIENLLLTNNNTTTTISTPTSSPSSPNNNKSNNSNLLESFHEYSQLFSDFISELDGLDGDISETLIDRKDVLWFLKYELYERFMNIQYHYEKDWRNIHDFRNGLILCLQEFKENVDIGIIGMDNNPKFVVDDDDGGGGNKFDEFENIGEINDTEQENQFINDEVVNDNDDVNNYNNNYWNDKSDNKYNWDILHQEITEREMIISKLQGRIVQLQERNQSITKHVERSTMMNGNHDHHHCEQSREYMVLHHKYKHLETRHRNVIHEMQESIQCKNEEIHVLKELLKEMENEIEHLSTQMNMALDLEEVIDETNQAEEELEVDEAAEAQLVAIKEDDSNRQRIIHEEGLKVEHNRQLLLYKDIEIKNLTEDIQERDVVIQEMKNELSKYKNEKYLNPSQQSDKIRLRYLEGIVHDLEEQLAKARGSSRNAIQYGSLAYFEVEGKINSSNNGGGSSEYSESTVSTTTLMNSTKDLELEKRIDELSDNLRRSEDEKECLRRELLQLKAMMLGSERNFTSTHGLK